MNLHIPAAENIIVSLFASLCLCAAASPSETFCQADGAPYTEIVIATDAPDTVKLAAKEFSEFVRESCGTELKICSDGVGTPGSVRVLIGKSPALAKLGLSAASMKSDGFRITSRHGFLAIEGRKDYGGPALTGFRDPWDAGTVFNKKMNIGAFGESGSLYGVYYFLQKYCGIRWYMPGPTGTVIPKKGKIIVPDLDLTVNPDFEYRFPLFCRFANDEESVLWFKRMRFGGAFPVQINHSFQFFKHYAKTNPEYFALVDGERDLNGGKCCVGHPHLCLNNPDVIDLWVKTICDYFDRHPEQYIYPIVPGDALNRVCECPSCLPQINRRANPDTGIFSNHIFGFVNKVAAKVARKHPDKFIGCAAYRKYSDPPDNGMKLEPNVVVLLCKRRGSFLNAEYRTDVRKRIEAWRTKAGNHMYFWDYYLDTDIPWRNLPVLFSGLIAEDLRYLNSIGACGEFVECGMSKSRMSDPAFQHLNIYLTGQLYWNCREDPAKILDEYFHLFYGPAETEMREFWLTAEKCRNEAGKKHLKAGLGTIRNELAPVDVFPAKVLNRMTSLLDTALRKTPENSVFRKRVELIRNSFLQGASSLRSMMRVGAIPEMTLSMSKSEADRFSAKPFEFASKTGEAASVKTWLYAGFDRENLYFRLIAFEPHMDRLHARAGIHDHKTVWNDDGVEFFICPDPSVPDMYFQFFATAKGTVWDASHSMEKDSVINPAWNSGCRTSAILQGKRWILEIAIPFRALGMDGSRMDGKMVLANFYRYRCAVPGEPPDCWSPTCQEMHFYPSKFGKIHFKDTDINAR